MHNIIYARSEVQTPTQKKNNKIRVFEKVFIALFLLLINNWLKHTFDPLSFKK